MPITTRALRRNVLSSLVRASLASTLVASSAHAASVCTVVNNADDPASASAAVTALTNSGTLRDCILASNLLTGSIGAPAGSMTISFAPGAFTGGAANTIALGDSLPMIFNNTTIDASALTQPVVIDGGGAHRIFFVSGLPDSTQDYNATGLPDPDGALPIAVTFKNLALRNGKAKGGDGGGGGLGAGGALFVNKNANVVLRDVSFEGNAALGGGALGAGHSVGGGGMGGSGGEYGAGKKYGGGGGIGGSGFYGGGGIGTAGSTTNAIHGAIPSYGGSFGGTGIGQYSSVQSFGIGIGPGVYGAPGLYSGGIGGGGAGTLVRTASGGFGGGAGMRGGNGGFGGGGSVNFNASAGGFGGGGGTGYHGRHGDGKAISDPYSGGPGIVGGAAGFGGGGGGGGGGGWCAYVSGFAPGWPGEGGGGGPGGVGGGGGANGNPSTPCPVTGPLSQDGAPGASGGGAGFGGAVFVRSGATVTVQAAGNAIVSGNNVTAGSGYRNGAAAGGGLFAMGGAALNFDISGRYTISDDIGDDSPTTLPAGHSYTPGAGAGLTVFKQGTGTLVLDASNTFSGLVAVGAGKLAGNGDVPAAVLLADGAAIAPGNPAIAGGIGTLSTGPLVWTPGSSISFQLGNTQAASDLLMINGALTKNGVGLPLRVNFGMGAKAPTPGVTYTLLTAQSLAGVAVTDFYHVEDATYGNLSGYFSLVGNSVTFTVDSVTSNRIFFDSFD